MNLYEKYNLITEQGPPPGGNPMAAMMGAMGGGKQGPPPSTEDQLFEKVRSYPKIDSLIQILQQKGVSDSHILDEIYTKFRPEFVYFAKEIILQENKPKPPAGPGGPGGMPGMPGGAGPVAEQFGIRNPELMGYLVRDGDMTPGSANSNYQNWLSNHLATRKPGSGGGRVPPKKPIAPNYTTYGIDGRGLPTTDTDGRPNVTFDRGDPTDEAIRREIRAADKAARAKKRVEDRKKNR